eukprot:TRINITY_DN33256_c0_g1_i1.p1 TRINITY_DN33256_c0_g1~~TRINITY_DN33256_c0_g1_i1.p1  ORF type:complete len:658 (+),score=126.87 TRINITY_DN33256_c0_g1_i1:97-2070(+)
MLQGLRDRATAAAVIATDKAKDKAAAAVVAVTDRAFAVRDVTVETAVHATSAAAAAATVVSGQAHAHVARASSRIDVAREAQRMLGCGGDQRLAAKQLAEQAVALDCDLIADVSKVHAAYAAAVERLAEVSSVCGHDSADSDVKKEIGDLRCVCLDRAEALRTALEAWSVPHAPTWSAAERDALRFVAARGKLQRVRDFLPSSRTATGNTAMDAESSMEHKHREEVIETDEYEEDNEELLFRGTAKTNIIEFYEVDHVEIGEGTSAKVCKGRSISTGQMVAIKSVSKSTEKARVRLQTEVSILKSLDHPNVIKLHDIFEDSRHVHVALELCEGGELFDTLVQRNRFEEMATARIMHQMFSVVHYLHGNHVAHRDIKPENLMLARVAPIDAAVVKVIDFGCSCRFFDDLYLNTKVGSAFYIAPEVLAGEYDEACDLWSLGVLMYINLCGYPPFYAMTDEEVYEKVTVGFFEFPAKDWTLVTEEARGLISMCLELNPRARCKPSQALEHAFFERWELGNPVTSPKDQDIATAGTADPAPTALVAVAVGATLADASRDDSAEAHVSVAVAPVTASVASALDLVVEADAFRYSLARKDLSVAEKPAAAVDVAAATSTVDLAGTEAFRDGPAKSTQLAEPETTITETTVTRAPTNSTEADSS